MDFPAGFQYVTVYAWQISTHCNTMTQINMIPRPVTIYWHPVIET